jgi:lipopolysaccharide export system ATP-binding protein
VLEATGLTKAFKGRLAVENVDIQVRQGEVVGLLGPNGAGKTTTFKMILGLLRPDEGSVRFGQLLDGMPLHKRARLGLGYLPQGASVFQGLSVEDNLLALFEALGRDEPEQRAHALLERFALGHLRKQKARTLSGGERRRLEFARALCPQPDILLCDEPFAGVDPIAVRGIGDVIKDLADSEVGVLLTDHSVRDALSSCHRIYLIVEGRIQEHGTPDHILKSENAKRLYLGDNF